MVSPSGLTQGDVVIGCEGDRDGVGGVDVVEEDGAGVAQVLAEASTSFCDGRGLIGGDGGSVVGARDGEGEGMWWRWLVLNRWR